MESRLGLDFSRVRVHSDAPAHRSAEQVAASAYTVGQHIVLGGNPGRRERSWLLAHELVHTAQQANATGSLDRLTVSHPDEAGERAASQLADSAMRAVSPRPPTLPVRPEPLRLQRALAGDTPSTPGSPTRLDLDVLAAENPEDFLVRAAAGDLGTDLRVRSMTDLVDQIGSRTSGDACVGSLDIFNHANPSIQVVAGGGKAKLPSGETRPRPQSGFSLAWLFDGANQPALNRLRGSFCCNAEMRWYGCTTAGVIAQGGTRTPAEKGKSAHRYQGPFGSFYQSVEDAAAHGATRFSDIGIVNVQSWSNALCTGISAATDYNSWTTRGGRVTRSVIYGGRQIRVAPQRDAGCSCETATGRVGGSVGSSGDLQSRAAALREEAIRPLYERTRGVIGSGGAPVAEPAEARTERERFEQAQAEHFQALGAQIRRSVLTQAGFGAGTNPATPEEALRVVERWGLSIDRIVAALPAHASSRSTMVQGQRKADDLHQEQRRLESALSPRGRETFLAALLKIRGDGFWGRHLATNTIFIFPDLTGLNRYRGFTQSGSRQGADGRKETVHVIHISRDLLEAGETDLVVANLVHELSHTAHEPKVLERAMEGLNRDLSSLLADHPKLVAARASAPDPAEARTAHVAAIRQILFEVTAYGEGEIISLLQQLTHQPSMTVSGTAVSASDFILDTVRIFVRRLRRIGLPPAMLSGVLRSIGRRTALLYDRRIAAEPEGSPARERLKMNQRLASAILDLAITETP